MRCGLQFSRRLFSLCFALAAGLFGMTALANVTHRNATQCPFRVRKDRPRLLFLTRTPRPSFESMAKSPSEQKGLCRGATVPIRFDSIHSAVSDDAKQHDLMITICWSVSSHAVAHFRRWSQTSHTDERIQYHVQALSSQRWPQRHHAIHSRSSCCQFLRR